MEAMSEPREPDLTPWGYVEPFAIVKQAGHFLYAITIHDGVFRWEPGGGGAWWAWGRKRAERKAKRLLRKHNLRQQRDKAATRVTL